MVEDFFKRSDVIREGRKVNVDNFIRTEGRIDLELHGLILSHELVISKIINRVIGGAEGIDMTAFNDFSRAECLQLLVHQVIDSISVIAR